MKQYLYIRSRFYSNLFHKKSIMVFIIVFLFALCSIILSLSIGEVRYNFIHVIKIIFGQGDDFSKLVIFGLRMPRVLGAFLVGASLATSGVLLQGVSKNPLADPNILGIVNGGAVGALVFLTLFTDPKSNSLTVSIFYMPFAVMVGAIIITFFIYIIAFKDGVTPFRLILVGIAMSGAARAIVTLLIVNGQMIFISKANLWLTGTLNGTNWIHVKLLGIWLLVWSLVTFPFMKDLNALVFDDSLTIGIGVSVKKKRGIILFLSTALASGAIAVGGGIGFVGLMAPHISRKLGNKSYESIFITSIFIGGITVVLADLVARTILSPLELPAGIFTAVIGAPFFIYLLWNNQK